LAVLLQANAVVRSVVMRATPVADMPFCSAPMAAMGGGAARAAHHTQAKAPHAACPFCEVATHVPLYMAAAPIPRCQAVAFIAFGSFPAHPLREPSAIVARARDPPHFRQI